MSKIDYTLLSKWQQYLETRAQSDEGLKYRRRVRRARVVFKSQQLCQKVPLIKPKHEYYHEGVGISYDGVGRATFNNLFACKNGWCCPVCSVLKARNLKATFGAVIVDMLKNRNVIPRMLTLTVPHYAFETAETVLERLNYCWRAAMHGHKCRASNQKYFGEADIKFIRVCECNYTDNGYHFHYHTLIFVSGDYGVVRAWADELQQRWVEAWKRSLTKAGLSDKIYDASYRSGVVLSKDRSQRKLKKRNLQKLLGYLLKGFGAEMTMGVSNAKGVSAHSHSRSMWEMLSSDDIEDNDKFYEYACATSQKQRVRMSPHLADNVEQYEEEVIKLLRDDDMEVKKNWRMVGWWSLPSWYEIIEDEFRNNIPHRANLIRTVLDSGGSYSALCLYCENNCLPLPFEGEEWSAINIEATG